ncbi:MAG: hypothetical protein ACRDRE_24145, partial [Pseudonocardiaceae bacterium]
HPGTGRGTVKIVSGRSDGRQRSVPLTVTVQELGRLRSGSRGRRHRAVATLYLLLKDHPIDPRGRCRSCRRPVAVFGSWRRRCRVHSKATLCLHQLDEVLLLRLLLADDLGLHAASPPAEPERAPASNPDDSHVLPAIAADPPT